MTPRSICLVANDLAYLIRNGGVGTYFWLLAHLLARHGWRVQILWCHDHVEDRRALRRVQRELAAAGIAFATLTDFVEPPWWRVPTPYDNWFIRRSEWVRHALEQLHSRTPFDLIEFADWWGAGFRSVQARRAGRALTDVPLAVKLHGSSQWARDGNGLWLTSKEDLRTDFAERHAFEHADLQLAPCRYMLDHARSAGWQVRDDARIAGYPIPLRENPAAYNGNAPISEVVFFGRLEPRKGLDIFLEACRELPQELKIGFVGKDTTLPDSQRATALIRSSLPGRAVVLHTDLNQEQALRYLGQGGRLAVMPSRIDNYPFTVLECASQGLPFLASGVGGIPERIEDAELRQRLLFAPTPADLERCLHAYLAAPAEQRREWSERVLPPEAAEASNRRLVEQYDSCLAAVRRTARSCGPARFSEPRLNGPLVSVVVPHYNLSDYLPEALASLVGQTYSPLEILVVDDGSTCPRALDILEQLRRRYPQVRFLNREHAGCGAARNAGLAEAAGTYVLLFDADNVAMPHMTAALVEGLERRPEVSALTCELLAFRRSRDIGEHKFVYRNPFPGGPHLMASFENVYGDTTALLRVCDLRAVGGYETDPSTPWEDWLTYVKLVHAGYRVEVLPEPLFYYRLRPDGRTARLNRGRHDEYVQTQRLLQRYFLSSSLPSGVDAVSLWQALVSFKDISDQQQTFGHRVLQRVTARLRQVPWLEYGLRRLARLGRSLVERMRR
jgi:glycosyltransferase involved in cell wall biosynthesis